jgi:hypothetical protein
MTRYHISDASQQFCADARLVLPIGFTVAKGRAHELSGLNFTSSGKTLDETTSEAVPHGGNK